MLNPELLPPMSIFLTTVIDLATSGPPWGCGGRGESGQHQRCVEVTCFQNHVVKHYHFADGKTEAGSG